MNKVKVGYIRVSTREQALESLSLERQEELVRKEGIDYLFTEVQSASKGDNRPELDKLLELVKARKIHVIIIPRLDRLVRSSRHLYKILEIIEDAGADLKILDFQGLDLTSPTGKMMLTFLGFIAEMETTHLSSRVKSEKKQRRQKQYANDITPLGYRVENHRYQLDNSPYLCLLSDKPQEKPQEKPEEKPEEIDGRTTYELMREVIFLFRTLKSTRAALHRFFQKYGIIPNRGKRSGVSKIISWTPVGFTNWLSNPVLQGHTLYLGKVAESIDAQNPDSEGPTLLYNTHPEECLISPEEAIEIAEALEISRRLGNKALSSNLDEGPIYQPFAYLNGLIYCNQCHARCTPKSSHRNKYQYFGCRYAGAGCNNRGSAKKSDIEEQLVKELTRTSVLMRQQSMRHRDKYDSLMYTVLQLQGASEKEIDDFAKTTAPQYDILMNTSVWSVETNLDRLKALREDINKLPNHHLLEETKVKIDKEIAEEEKRERSFLDKTAGEIIFNGNNLAYWQALANDDKITVYSKVVDKIFVENGQVTQIHLKAQSDNPL